MMNLRKSALPPGWYPQNPAKIDEFLGGFAQSAQKTPLPGPVIAAVAPHAGWYYSGAAAAQAVSTLAMQAGQCGTIAVIGGHLPDGAPALFAMEDAVATPLGDMEIDAGLRSALIKKFGEIPGLETAQDQYQDNTVEALLPMVKYFFPKALLLWLRLPACMASYEAGKALAATASSLGTKLLVLGSTDLTHYGAAYGFSPRGSGKEALSWVKSVNDRRFIEAVEAGDPRAVLSRATEEHSACSAGAVLGVMGYAEETRTLQNKTANCAGELIAYHSSADTSIEDGEGIPSSFVGYGAFVFNA